MNLKAIRNLLRHFWDFVNINNVYNKIIQNREWEHLQDLLNIRNQEKSFLNIYVLRY